MRRSREILQTASAELARTSAGRDVKTRGSARIFISGELVRKAEP